MATATFAQLKDWLARNIGETDSTSVDTAGAALINDAHKELSSRFPFNCNLTVGSDLTIAGNSATLPSDFDYSHKNEIEIYSYSGTTKTEYKSITPSEKSRYGSTDYVFYIDEKNSCVKSNQSSATLSLDYYAIPEVMSDDGDTTNFPVPKAISMLAAGDYWSDFEEEEDRADKKYSKAEMLFMQAIERNKIERNYGLKFRGLNGNNNTKTT